MHSALVLPELIDLVFRSLDCQSLCAAGSVCREWRKASQEEKYWTRLEFSSASGHCSPDDSAMVGHLRAQALQCDVRVSSLGCAAGANLDI